MVLKLVRINFEEHVKESIQLSIERLNGLSIDLGVFNKYHILESRDKSRVVDVIYSYLHWRRNFYKWLDVAQQEGIEQDFLDKQEYKLKGFNMVFDFIIGELDRQWLITELLKQAQLEIEGAKKFLEALKANWEKYQNDPDKYHQVVASDWEYWGRILYSRETVEDVAIELEKLGSGIEEKHEITKDYDDLLKKWGIRLFDPVIRDGSLALTGKYRAAPRSYWWFYLNQPAEI